MTPQVADPLLQHAAVSGRRAGLAKPGNLEPPFLLLTTDMNFRFRNIRQLVVAYA
jgi:hypothetical protein